MRIAIPLTQGQVCAHFGHSEQFLLVDVDPEAKQILQSRPVASPLHAPGVIPRWLADQDVSLVMTGGIGQRALHLFQSLGIQVITGIPFENPETLLSAYLAGTLQTGQNLCDH